MKIQILGSGCPTCKQLLETTKKVVQDLKIDVKVEYITDVAKLIEMEVMTSPILAIDGKPVLTGGGKTEEDIKKALENNNKKEKSVTSNRACNGKC